MYALRMLPLGVGSRTENALRICLVHGLSQAGTAAYVGASQPQVSRILKGERVLVSRLFEKIYLFVEQFDAGVSVETVRANKDLIEALRVTWNGSAVHAKALSAVIRSMALLKPEKVHSAHPKKKTKHAFSVVSVTGGDRSWLPGACDAHERVQEFGRSVRRSHRAISS